ncbi:MAG: acyl carrier protein [Clostridia bacterium]|nr:acyl carrier protein [Clostridia bacterium]
MDIFAYLRKAVHELVGIPEEDITPESTPRDLRLDSFDVEELVLDVEREFDVFLPEEAKFETLEELAQLVVAA